MCLRPTLPPDVPTETATVARAAFPRGNPYLQLRDTFGALFVDAQFAPLFPSRGQPAHAPWRLALVTLLQFAEGLSDRQAADAVRARIDWKYLLALELPDPGFDFSVLCEFRERLLAGGAEQLLLDTLLGLCRTHQLLPDRGKQRSDSTHVVAAVRKLNRLELVGETLRHALDALATVAPEWLRPQVAPEWAARYARPFDEFRLPRAVGPREQLAVTIGEDGMTLLRALFAPTAPPAARALPAVEALRRVWVQQYVYAAERLRWRRGTELPPAPLQINTPLDLEARYSEKRGDAWVGYKVHFTETCEAGAPLLITAVQTTPAPVPDQIMLGVIQADLAARNLLPATQYVDAGYVTAKALAESVVGLGVTVVGPAPRDTAWQARQGAGFAAHDFQVDWAAQRVTCPAGQASVYWQPRESRGRARIQVRFDPAACQACASRDQCTQQARRGRSLTLLPEAEHQALAAARRRQAQPEYGATQAPRAGIEGTHSQAVRRSGVRTSRYVGAAKTHLQHLATAAGLNLLRVGHWLLGTPRARTRQSAFTQFMAAPS